MRIMRIGIDLAKQVFQIHGVDSSERPVLRRQLTRHQMVKFFSKLMPCLIGMEACASSHYWARRLRCRRYLRSTWSTEHAVCGHQDGGAAGYPGIASDSN